MKCTGLTKSFGGLVAINNVSFQLQKAEGMGLIGPNGSGKTTLLNVINGIYSPDKGSIWLNGEQVHGLKPHELARRGIARIFQAPSRLFYRMTVLENMLVPPCATKISHRPEDCIDKGKKLLDFVGLAQKSDVEARHLSGGQQRLLEFARALMLDPSIMLLDEPFAGVHPRIKEEMINRIRDLRQQGVAFILVSHELIPVLGLCGRVMVLCEGEVVADDTPEKIRKNEKVVKAYLGERLPSA